MKTTITVALVYDFDGTLSPGNMQEYDFIPAVGKSNKKFWQESNQIAIEQDADPILAYMYKMIHEAKSRGLSLRKEAFSSSGAKITLFEGVEQWFSRINAYGESCGVKIEHYINSSGIKEMIEGTSIAKEFKKIYACSFLYDVDGVAYWPAVAVNYTNKTQFIFKINKGIDTVFDSHLINQYISPERRVVPFSRMIYVGDGNTDIPCMKLVRQQGGHSIAVFNPADVSGRGSLDDLLRDDRVGYVCAADYRADSELDVLVRTIVDKIVSDYRLEGLMSETQGE